MQFRLARFDLAGDVAIVRRYAVREVRGDESSNDGDQRDSTEQCSWRQRKEITGDGEENDRDNGDGAPTDGQRDEAPVALQLFRQRLEFPPEKYFSHDALSACTGARRESRAAIQVSTINITSVATINHRHSFWLLSNSTARSCASLSARCFAVARDGTRTGTPSFSNCSPARGAVLDSSGARLTAKRNGRSTPTTV